MKLAFITPTAYLKRFESYSDIFLAEAQICYDDEDYKNYFITKLEEGRHVILDNSPGIRRDITLADYLDLAYLMKPTELVAINSHSNTVQSIDDTIKFMQLAEEFGLMTKGIKIMGVVQGNNFSEWVECYKALDRVVRVSSIGFTRPLDTFEELNYKTSLFSRLFLRFKMTQAKAQALTRVSIINGMYQKGIINTNKPHHLLGLTDGIELKWHVINQWIRSNDSSSAFHHGAQGIRYKRNGLPGEKDHYDLDFNLNRLSDKETQDIHYNMMMMKRFIEF